MKPAVAADTTTDFAAHVDLKLVNANLVGSERGLSGHGRA